MEVQSKAMTWAGRVLSALASLFLAFDATIKLMDLPMVRAAQVPLGWPPQLDRTLGVIELVCLVLYVVPPTAVLGAVLITGLLGGAIATHLRVSSPLLGYTLFGVYVGVVVGGGLLLREPRLRALMPLRR